jgi:ABC-type transporter Mla MlaB component
LTKDVAMELRADFARREVGRPGGDKEPMRMTTVTSHGLWTFALEVTTTAHGRTVRAYGRLLVGAGADHPVWAGLVAGDALDVTLDLSEVTAIDAGGLGRLLRVRRRLAARGARLTISAAAPRVGRMLHMTGLDAIFGIASGPAASQNASIDVPSCLLLCRCA